MNSKSRFQKEVDRHINFWFHTPKRDSIAPLNTIAEFTTLFLQAVRRLGFCLIVDEIRFRRYMCEAICMIYQAKKLGKYWHGPLTEVPRPDGWTDKHETEWKELLHINYFTSNFFDSIWSCLEEGLWEAFIPNWRNFFEYIVIHYIAVKTNLLEDGYKFEQDKSSVSAFEEYYSE
jgi:hypothetical protein